MTSFVGLVGTLGIKQIEGGSVRLFWLALALMGPLTCSSLGPQGGSEPERGSWGRGPDCQGPYLLQHCPGGWKGGQGSCHGGPEMKA